MLLQYTFVFDQTRCIGCKNCLVACKTWNKIGPGPVAWRKHEEYESGKLEWNAQQAGETTAFRIYNMVKQCYHCDDPKCVASCAAGAIIKDSTNGMVIIDRNKCLGLRTCEPACPYGNISHAENGSDQETVREDSWQTDHPAQKCTMCYDRLAINKQPSCVGACQNRALDFGTVQEMTFKYRDRLTQDAPGFSDEGTGPNFFIIRKVDRVFV